MSVLSKRVTKTTDVLAPDEYDGRLGKLNAIIVGDDALGHLTIRYLSLVLLLVATVVGCMTFTQSGFFGSSDVSLRPDMLSGIFGILLIAPLYLRRIITWSPSIYYILSAVLNVTVTAVLIQAVLGAASTTWLSIPLPFVLALGLAMTWLGIRPLAPLAWACVILLGILNLQAASEAMGLWGYLFVISAGLGIFLQFPFEPQKMLKEVKYDFIGPPEDLIEPTNSLMREEVLDRGRDGDGA
ncbi:hypothetical protein SAMN04488515_2863 [Cognatiyoonia koreensis]|uniref:Uncharacterized protein n=1 Tax=Cognatiyoonia koreensis TaxID=364200 RepID=A0A1I0RMG4_9RHOB|nr:hypothetical protein SAMN04488515_2863 [Cognatiyoonia koreensis]